MVTVQVLRNLVIIEIDAPESDLKTVNSYIEGFLDLMKDEGAIRWYRNKVDRFIVMPAFDWTPAEVATEFKQLVRISRGVP